MGPGDRVLEQLAQASRSVGAVEHDRQEAEGEREQPDAGEVVLQACRLGFRP